VSDQPKFEPFPKIPRLKRDCVITEKIDGTNASVLITDDGDMHAASRTRWVMPGKDDNYGWAGFVAEHSDTFFELGTGHHFGEWWGAGIQRRYGLAEKRFSLFNTGRWTADTCPVGLHVVPVLYHGPFSTDAVEAALCQLRESGSVAAPGFMRPEGVVVFHVAARTLSKVTVDADDEPKSRSAA